MKKNLQNKYHPLTEEIKTLLVSKGLPYNFYEHKAVKSSVEANAAREGYSLSEGVKALILKIYSKNKNAEFIQVAIPGDSKFSSLKLRKILSISNLTFATPQELDKLTNGVLAGGIPPFGQLFNIPVYLDKSVLQNKKIIFNCGDRRTSISMNTDDYVNLVSPILVDIVG